jgi:hypothetical protein
MICTGCGAENRADAKFCHGCGSRLSANCTSCGAELRPEAKFCDNCGTPVADTGEPTNAATPNAATRAASRGADQPDSFADGRYVTKRLLGEGGKKKVYLAADTLLDRQVAIAVLKSASGDEPSRDRLTREAQAMGRIGDHPNVLPIYDYGAHNADPGALAEPIRVRMGLHMGEAIAEEGDFFGKSVILASRIAESASGDQILVSSEIVRALQSETDFTFASTGSARLSGLSDEYELFEVGPSSDLGATPGPGTTLAG